MEFEGRMTGEEGKAPVASASVSVSAASAQAAQAQAQAQAANPRGALAGTQHPWTCQFPGCNTGPGGGPYQTRRHKSRVAHLEEMQIHMCCIHPGALQSTRAAAGIPPPVPVPPVVFLEPKNCEFPECTWSTPAEEKKTREE